MVYTLIESEESFIGIDFKSKIVVITELYKPVIYGKDRNCHIEVLEHSGYHIEYDNKEFYTDLINEYKIIGEL